MSEAEVTDHLDYRTMWHEQSDLRAGYQIQVNILERALRMALARDTGDPDHDWTTCQQITCVMGRRALGVSSPVKAEDQHFSQPEDK